MRRERHGQREVMMMNRLIEIVAVVVGGLVGLALAAAAVGIIFIGLIILTVSAV